MRLRWVAVTGQLVTIGFVHFGLGITLPNVALGSLVGLTIVSNLVLSAWIKELQHRTEPVDRQRESWVLVMILALDLVLLSAMLSFTGGVSNPFSVFYLVNVGLSASVVEKPWAWGLFALAACGFFALLFVFVDLPVLRRNAPGVEIGSNGMVLPPVWQWGILVAFLTCGIVIVHFSARVQHELRKREQALRDAGEQQARSEKLEALTTLAAGAAHELATPLSTIAVVAREMERALARLTVDASVQDDIGLIRREVDRCRAILDRMANDAGQPSGEAICTCTVSQLIERVVSEIEAGDKPSIQLDASAALAKIHIPIEGTAQAIRGLVRNAIDASPIGLSIALTASLDSAQRVSIRVRDRGTGMTEAILQRVSEPFFTTKAPGAGMGLGVFLARTVIERLGGSLRFESAPHQGTVVIIELPIAAAPPVA